MMSSSAPGNPIPLLGFAYCNQEKKETRFSLWKRKHGFGEMQDYI